MKIASKPFILPASLLRQIKFISPNIYELNAICEQMNYGRLMEDTNIPIAQLFNEVPNLLKDIKDSTKELLEIIDNIILTLGPKGILLMRKNPTHKFLDENHRYISNSDIGSCELEHKLYGIGKVSNIVNLSGAGDGFNAGFISALIRGYPDDICISVGLECAKSAMRSDTAVPPVFLDADHKCWNSHASFTTIE